MKDFYIFLDIDGVMWDWDFAKSHYKSFPIKKFNEFNPQSIQALNMLILSLEKQFGVQLVISSTRRNNLFELEQVFKQNKIAYHKPLQATPFLGSKRGKEILEFLKGATNQTQFCIIDDETSDMPQFHKDRIIKTEIFHASLKPEQVSKFLLKLPQTLKTNPFTTAQQNSEF